MFSPAKICSFLGLDKGVSLKKQGLGLPEKSKARERRIPARSGDRQICVRLPCKTRLCSLEFLLKTPLSIFFALATNFYFFVINFFSQASNLLFTFSL